MFKEFRTSLTPVVLEMVQAIQNPCDPEDMVAILSKDAGESNLIVFDDGYDDMYDHDNTYNACDFSIQCRWSVSIWLVRWCGFWQMVLHTASTGT